MQKTFKAKINKKSKDEPKIVYSIKLSEEVLQLLEEKAPAAINLETNVYFFYNEILTFYFFFFSKISIFISI